MSFSRHRPRADRARARRVLHSSSWQTPSRPVDDEEHLRSTVSKALRREGFCTRLYADGEEAWQAMEDSLPDLLILDIIMPRMDGLELCRRVRAVSAELPVMFLTSRDEEFDRVLGLELGADDYLCKPFSLRELVARVKVLFRRAGRGQPGREPATGEELAAGPLRLDARRFTAAWGSTPIRLTVTEFRILSSLVRQPGYVRTREQLLAEAFPHDAYMSDRTVDCHIKRIRKKLSAAAAGFDSIETLYGLGYRWRGDA